MSDQIRVTRTVTASPEQLFALLATPTRHQDIDGSSMMRGIASGPDTITAVGDEFVMNMHNDVLGDYQMHNRVTAYEPDRTIGWAPSIHPLDGYTDKLGDAQATGHTYTWQLALAGTGTTVTQTYDWSGVTDPAFRGFFPLLSEQQITDSIDNAASAAR